MASNALAEQDKLLEELEKAEIVQDDHNESPPADIVAYNELRSCADLYRMADEGNLIIQPDFQRDFIWKGTDQTRFIDSLVKQLPVPSMCFAFDFKQNTWIVIDGLQRISTIVRFLKGDDWKLSSLDDIDPNLKGKNAATLKTSKTAENRVIFSRVQNQALPINILRCDLNKRTHNEYIYMIFHRLNSGGIKLNNQEIRNCIYSGNFNRALRELDEVEDWRYINNMRPGENYRFTKQETILRFFSFMERRDNYKGSVSKFLNDYMFDKRNIDELELDTKKALFRSVAAAMKAIFADQVPTRLPGTVLEAAMIGIAHNLTHVSTLTPAEKRMRFEQLRAHPSLSAEYLAEGLSKPDRVNARLNAAIEIFAT